MNQRKKLTRVLDRLGVHYSEMESRDGTVTVEFAGSTFVFDGKKYVSSTSTAAHKRWSKKPEQNGETRG